MPSSLPPLMQLALDLAESALFITSPNPRVGCVISAPDGRVLGQGHTQRAGEAHAEIMALRQAAALGHDVRGGTAWVTLEPCSHQGRTGPCCEALIQAGLARVVAALEDPNPLVAGQGFARLRAAGLAVEVGPGAAAARELNLGFFSRMLRHSPWVRAKVAMSLDGTTALPNGRSQWITGPAARADGQAWRARACAVLTGVGTVLADNPRLDVRELATPRQPRLVLVDSQLRTPPEAAVFETQRERLVYTASTDAERMRRLEARGVQIVHLPAPAALAGPARVDLRAMLADLARRGINELHVEAGAQLNGALLRADAVDEWLNYLAPKLLGPGAGMAAWGPLEQLDQARALVFHAVCAVGPDLRILARAAGRADF